MVKILVDILHPAHVLLFMNPVKAWINKGYKVIITSRNKDVASELLTETGLPHRPLSTAGRGIIPLFCEMIQRDIQLYRIAEAENVNLMAGTSPMIAQVSRFAKAKSVIFEEDDWNVKKLMSMTSVPLSDYYCTPDCLSEDHGKKHFKYPSYHELSYLHPEHFTPDIAIYDELKIGRNQKFFILRFVNLTASHDLGETGLSHQSKLELIKLLEQYGKVFISSEGTLDSEFTRYRIPVSGKRLHHALYYASLYAGDSQTMCCEAAVLGTPAIRCNSFVGRISYLEELCWKYGLTRGFRPGETRDMIGYIKSLLDDPDTEMDWKRKRNFMLSQKINCSRWIIQFIDALIHFHGYR